MLVASGAERSVPACPALPEMLLPATRRVQRPCTLPAGIACPEGESSAVAHRRGVCRRCRWKLPRAASSSRFASALNSAMRRAERDLFEAARPAIPPASLVRWTWLSISPGRTSRASLQVDQRRCRGRRADKPRRRDASSIAPPSTMIVEARRARTCRVRRGSNSLRRGSPCKRRRLRGERRGGKAPRR